MNIKEITKIGSLTALAVIAGLLASQALVKADETDITPGFNKYDSVNLHYGVGPESDFIRFGNKGELGIRCWAVVKVFCGGRFAGRCSL